MVYLFINGVVQTEFCCKIQILFPLFTVRYKKTVVMFVCFIYILYSLLGGKKKKSLFP